MRSDSEISADHTANLFTQRRHRIAFGIALFAILMAVLWNAVSNSNAGRRIGDNIHWTVSFSLCAWFAIFAWREGKGDQRSVLGWFAVGCTTYALGQLVYDVQVSLDWLPFPGPSDYLFLLQGIGFVFGVCAVYRGRRDKTLLKHVLLDSGIFTVAALALTLAVYLPRQGDHSGYQLVFLGAYPAILFCASSILGFSILRLRPKFHFSWFLLQVSLLGETAMWMAWNAQFLDGTIADGSAFNIIFTLLCILKAACLGCWSFQRVTGEQKGYLAQMIVRLLPLGAVIMGCTAIVITNQVSTLSPSVKNLAFGAAFCIVLLAVVRQTIFVREIEESEQRYELAIQGSSDAIWDWDLRSGEFVTSGQVREMFGYLPDEFPHKVTEFSKLVHPEDKDDVVLKVQNHFENGSEYDTEYRVLTKNDGYKWFHVRGEARRDRSGKPIRFLGSIRDIQDRKQAEDQARQLLRFQRAILDNAGFAVITANSSGTITLVNPKAEAMLGRNAYELVGKATPEIFHDPEELERRRIEFSASLCLDIEPGFAVFVAEANAGRPSVHEWTYIRPDGTRIPVLLSVTRLESEAGELDGYMGIAADISDRKTAERLLRESEEKFSRVFYSVPDMLSISRATDLVFIDVNPSFEKSLGIKHEDIVGHTSGDFFTWLHPERREEMIALMSANGSVKDFECEVCTKNGGILTVLLTVTPIEVAGEVLLLTVGHDITEIKAAEKQIRDLNSELEVKVQERTAELLSSNAELESFAYSVSHDLRAPLRGIDGFSRLLAEGLDSKTDPKNKHYLERICAASTRMGDIIDSLLDLSRVTRSTMKMEPVDLSLLARDWVEDHSSQLENRSIRWNIDPSIAVIGDQRLLANVVNNLLNNAVKYTANVVDTDIHISAKRGEGDTISTTFSDNGAGFDMAHVERVFRPFQRLHRVDEFPGSGIGLATVYRIIQRHGGQIIAKGEVGKGASFEIRLRRPKE